MKRLTIMNRFWYCFIGGSIAAILIFSLPIGCKTVSKTQTNKAETTTVSKSDSSSVNTYTVIDTTKTDSSTEITTYTITADSVDFYDYVPKGDYHNTGISNGFPENYKGMSNTPIGYWHPTGNTANLYPKIKAKGVKITGTTKTQKAIVNKGETTQALNQQTDIKSDSVATKTESVATTTKTAHPIKIIFGIGLLLIVIVGSLYLYYKVYR